MTCMKGNTFLEVWVSLFERLGSDGSVGCVVLANLWYVCRPSHYVMLLLIYHQGQCQEMRPDTLIPPNLSPRGFSIRMANSTTIPWRWLLVLDAGHGKMLRPCHDYPIHVVAAPVGTLRTLRYG